MNREPHHLSFSQESKRNPINCTLCIRINRLCLFASPNAVGSRGSGAAGLLTREGGGQSLDALGCECANGCSATLALHGPLQMPSQIQALPLQAVQKSDFVETRLQAEGSFALTAETPAQVTAHIYNHHR